MKRLGLTTPPDFELVDTFCQIQQLENLAHTIWHEHYPGIITKEQIAYMLKRFQSSMSITQQIADGYRYFLISSAHGNSGADAVGYLALRPDQESVFLSKMYVLKEFRNMGIGSSAMQFIERQCQQLNRKSIWLTVNRQNRGAIDAYQRWGFIITNKVVANIGRGYVMDDYRMEKSLRNRES